VPFIAQRSFTETGAPCSGAQRFTFGAAGIGGCSVLTGAVGADFGVGMQFGIERRNACEVVLGDFARGERPSRICATSDVSGW
jgi:hypothetical protein